MTFGALFCTNSRSLPGKPPQNLPGIRIRYESTCAQIGVLGKCVQSVGRGREGVHQHELHLGLTCGQEGRRAKHASMARTEAAQQPIQQRRISAEGVLGRGACQAECLQNIYQEGRPIIQGISAAQLRCNPSSDVKYDHCNTKDKQYFW